jgi:succinylglutamate desuccinylase
MNRAWTLDGIRAALKEEGSESPEDREQIELLEVVQGAIDEARGRVFLLDLHTTSGPGEPFSTIMDSLSSRRFAMALPVPLILGLGELVEGTLLGALGDRGVPAMVFEGGKHDELDAVSTSEAAVWLSLAAAGVVNELDVPEVTWGRKLLMGRSRGLPPVFEMRYRHPVTSSDGFEMLPGFRSFQPVSEGDILARDRRGEVRSPESGRLLMPLYQVQGEDGFFLIREFDPFWLSVSEILRRLRVGKILHWLPGVDRDPGDGHRLRVDLRVARWFTLELLHLLGYRKTKQDGARLVVLRETEWTPRGSKGGAGVR